MAETDAPAELSRTAETSEVEMEEKPQTREPVVGDNPNAVDLTPEKDGGVFKEILHEGTGEDGPLTGDEVFVHYDGTLTDGTKFDSSRDRGERFKFKLGQGSVIKAWDLGVATMKRGEVARLTARSDYAYGESGAGDKIPPNSTLVFEVELFEWKGEDLSDEKDERITRSILEKGSGYEKPNDGATVEIHLTGKYNEKIFEDRDVEFILGEGSSIGIISGVEQALLAFKKDELSRLTIKPSAAYGREGNTEKGIPGDATVVYEVHLKKFEKAKETWEMDTEEKFEQAEMAKTKGTNFFKIGNFAVAKKYYEKVVEFIKDVEDEAKDEKYKKLLLAGHLNLSMCLLKLGEDHEAKQHCIDALELDPKNEKALFRRGQAHVNTQDYELAIADFKAVLQVDANNKAAKNQLTLAANKIRQQKEKEKKLYKGMFEKFSAVDGKKEEELIDMNKEKGSGDEINGKNEKSEDEMLTKVSETDGSPKKEESLAEPVHMDS